MTKVNLSIVTTPFMIDLYGFSGTAVDGNWKDTGFALMNRMWERVKARNLRNKGINVWLYTENNGLFTGVELEDHPIADTGLEYTRASLEKYLYYKHIGPYHQIPEVYTQARAQMKQNGWQTHLPYLEIYGHWMPDESKLETEILWGLK